MNGVDGMNGHDNSGETTDVNVQVLQALEIIHNPRSTNSLRQTASQYLEGIKSDKEAPYRGFILASTRSQPPAVRHYGLGLLGHAIRHHWADYTPDQRTALRDWVLELAQGVADTDPLYIRNKLAELWVETAKRSWVLEWMDMDEFLVRLWDGSVTQKLLVLSVLETLSEDIFGHEDTAAALRGTELNRACVDIFTPALVLSKQFPSRETSVNVRYGEDGWLSRVGDLLERCTDDGKINEMQQACAVKALATFRSAVGWVIPKALVATNTLERTCRCLAASDLSVQLVGWAPTDQYEQIAK
jgi:exportin-5